VVCAVDVSRFRILLHRNSLVWKRVLWVRSTWATQKAFLRKKLRRGWLGSLSRQDVRQSR
jgi:hypothetical protein